jgi:hypothetical protein
MQAQTVSYQPANLWFARGYAMMKTKPTVQNTGWPSRWACRSKGKTYLLLSLRPILVLLSFCFLLLFIGALFLALGLILLAAFIAHFTVLSTLSRDSYRGSILAVSLNLLQPSVHQPKIRLKRSEVESRFAPLPVCCRTAVRDARWPCRHVSVQYAVLCRDGIIRTGK